MNETKSNLSEAGKLHGGIPSAESKATPTLKAYDGLGPTGRVQSNGPNAAPY
jgi:hypothetical protein